MISTPLTGPVLTSLGGGRLHAPSSSMVCSLTVASQQPQQIKVPHQQAVTIKAATDTSVNVPTCIVLKLGPVGAGVALQGGAVVQAQDVVGQVLLRLLGFGQLVGPHQADGLEALSDHDELHPLSRQRHQALFESDEGGDAVVLGGDI